MTHPTAPLRRLFRVVNGGTPEPNPDYWDGDVMWLTPQDLGAVDGGIANASRRTLSKQGIGSSNAVMCPVGSIVVSTRAPVGYVAELGSPAATNQGCRTLLPLTTVDSRFYRYVLCASRQALEARAQGTTFLELTSEGLASLSVPAPPLVEQRAIADYLDRETARIDALIAAKRAMIQLLEERWGRSLDDWIWSNTSTPIVSLRRLCILIRDGTHQPPQRVADGYPLLSVRNLVDGELIFREDDSMISAADYRLMARALSPQVDDVALAIVGATLGKTALVRELPPFALQRSVAILRSNRKRMRPLFLKLVLDSPRCQELLRSRLAFSAQPGIYLADLAELAIPAPSLSRQQLIEAQAASAWSNHQQIVSCLGTQVSGLTERRQALITAAVTAVLKVVTV